MRSAAGTAVPARAVSGSADAATRTSQLVPPKTLRACDAESHETMSVSVSRSALIDRSTAVTYAAWFKALADPTRVQILNLLAAAHRPLSVGEIVKHAEVGQPTVSHHLKILAEIRFVLRRRDGTNVLYTVDRAALESCPSAADAVCGRPRLR